MARRYNTRHNRARSRYPERLARRGQTPVSVRMTDPDTLRARQERRSRLHDDRDSYGYGYGRAPGDSEPPAKPRRQATENRGKRSAPNAKGRRQAPYG